MQLSVRAQLAGATNRLSLCLNLSLLRCQYWLLQKKRRGGGKLLLSFRENKFLGCSSMKEKYCKKAVKNML